MRVLRIYPFLPPLPGGMEKHVRRLTEEQRAGAVEVTIMYNAGDATGPDDVRVLPGMNLRRVRPQALRDLLFYSATAMRVISDRLRADVVHVHGDWSAFLLGRMIGRLARARSLAASIHGAARGGIWRHVYRAALVGYGFAYATGADEARFLEAVAPGRVFHQCSGVSDEFFSGSLKPAVRRTIDVIVVGSLLPVKNMGLVVEIAARLPDLRFVLAGDGPEKARIEARRQELGARNLTLVGRVTQAEVKALLDDARVFLSTSIAEGTPTAALEAMACGNALVMSRSNAYDHLFFEDGTAGYIVDGFDPSKFVTRISELVTNLERLDGIAAASREAAGRFRWSKVANRINDRMAASLRVRV